MSHYYQQMYISISIILIILHCINWDSPAVSSEQTQTNCLLPVSPAFSVILVIAEWKILCLLIFSW